MNRLLIDRSHRRRFNSQVMMVERPLKKTVGLGKNGGLRPGIRTCGGFLAHSRGETKKCRARCWHKSMTKGGTGGFPRGSDNLARVSGPTRLRRPRSAVVESPKLVKARWKGSRTRRDKIGGFDGKILVGVEHFAPDQAACRRAGRIACRMSTGFSLSHYFRLQTADLTSDERSGGNQGLGYYVTASTPSCHTFVINC